MRPGPPVGLTAADWAPAARTNWRTNPRNGPGRAVERPRRADSRAEALPPPGGWLVERTVPRLPAARRSPASRRRAAHLHPAPFHTQMRFLVRWPDPGA